MSDQAPLPGILTPAEHERRPMPERVRAMCRELARSMSNRRSPFEHWSKVVTQNTVDDLKCGSSADDLALLERFRAHGVIDEQDRIVPHPERAAHAEAYASRRRDDVAEYLAKAEASFAHVNAENAFESEGPPA